MFMRKGRRSRYAWRLSSPRVTPTNSMSNVEWNNERIYSRRETTSRFSSKKIKYYSIVIGCGLTIAILIIIAVVLPTITKSKSVTTQSTVSTSSSSAVANILATATNRIINTPYRTETSTTSTASETSTTTTSPTTSTSSDATSSTTSTSTSTSTDTTSPTTSTSTSTSSDTTSTTASTSTSSNTTTTTTDTSTSTTSDTTTTTTSTSTSTSSDTTTTTTSTSTSTTSDTTTTATSTSTSTSSDTTSTTTTTSTTMTPLRWNTTGITIAGNPSMTNATSNYLSTPRGIVFDLSDALYVSDTNHNRIQQFLLGNSNGTTVAGNATGASSGTANFLNFPNDVAVDSYGNVYVADTFNNRVQLWYVNATSGVTIATGGGAGNVTISFSQPRGIAFDSNTNTFLVSDTLNHRVLRFTLNSTVGVLVAGGNGAGSNNTQLNSPSGLYFDYTTNSLFIANHGANNVVQWFIGASTWSLVAGNINGSSGNSPTAFNLPWDVTLDPMKNVYVADANNHRIQFFRPGEFNGTTIAGVTSASGNTAVKLNQPYSVALDSQLNLYVADLGNNRIQTFLRY